MKKIALFILGAAALVGCTSNQGTSGPTIFEGRFIGYNGEYTEFFLPTDSGTFREIPVNVHEDGTFCDTIDFGKDYFDAPLFADKFMFRVSVQQGKTYHAEFDITEEGVESNFSFTGEGAAENEFMKHYWQNNNTDVIQTATSYADCKQLLDNAFNPLRDELSKINNKPFVEYYLNELANLEPKLSAYAPFYAAQANGGKYADDPAFAAYAAEHYNLPEAELQQLLSNTFTNVGYMFGSLEATEALKAAASCVPNADQKEFAMTMMLQALISAGNTTTLKQAYEYYKENVTNADLLKSVEEICVNAITLGPGADAPEIEFRDQKGRVKKLSDFRGKPLYVDFWASWCGPCCKEIPHLAKFVESLGANPEINCISISIDDNESDWTRKLAEEPDTWPQFLATEAGQKSISDKYNVHSIPRFMLFDAQGKIASVNAPRPSDSELLEKLRELLDTKGN